MSQPFDNPTVPPPKRRRRRGSTLRQRLVVWSVAAVVVPTFACVIVTNFLALRSLNELHVRATDQLAHVAAGALSGRIDDGFTDQARAVVDRLREDPRIALIEVNDNKGNVMFRPVDDGDAWNALQETEPTFTGTRGVKHPSGYLAVNRTPIVNAGKDGKTRVEGYLSMVVRDRDASGMLYTLNLLQFGVAGAVCLLVVPVIALTVARWTAPLRPLRQAVGLLSRGQVPQPVRVERHDDLGQLCEAFNAMVRSLFEAQTQLSESNARLEQLVKQRTAEVRHANTKLEAEANDKNEFLRAVSHDLNAPMRNISGMTQMLLMKHRDALTDDAVSKLERISANAKHQSELIGDLLELSRLRTKEPKPETFDLSELVHRIADNLAFDLEEAGIELCIEGELPTVYAEKNRLRQVFQNLIDNAVKYMMDSKDRRVTVSGQRTRDFRQDAFNGQDVWEFRVADTGRGIAEEDVGSVFQVFARSTHSGTHEVAGRGVGLASVKAIVEQYSGELRVESTLGEGSTFIFTLPVDRVSPPSDREIIAAEAEAGELSDAA